MRGEPVFLGLTPDGAPRFARAVEAAESAGLLARAGADAAFLDLRSLALGGLLGSEELAILAHAKPLLGWHANHRYCARCGAPTQMLDGGASRGCGQCGTRHFPRTDPAVIMLISHGDHCLLARNAHLPPGMFSTLAGFVDQGETIEEAVRREVMEETGVHVGHIHYHSSQPWPFPSSLMIGCFAEAGERTLAIDPQELEEAYWFSRANLKRMFATAPGEGPYISPPFSIAHHLIRHFADHEA
jgi:NAD+ diphosphatase